MVLKTETVVFPMGARVWCGTAPFFAMSRFYPMNKRSKAMLRFDTPGQNGAEQKHGRLCVYNILKSCF
jgi:hypothetical protein